MLADSYFAVLSETLASPTKVSPDYIRSALNLPIRCNLGREGQATVKENCTQILEWVRISQSLSATVARIPAMSETPEKDLEHQLEDEIAFLSINQLTELGNQAIAAGLIIGHGFHGGQYEILRRGEVLLYSPEEAQAYLAEILRDHG